MTDYMIQIRSMGQSDSWVIAVTVTGQVDVIYVNCGLNSRQQAGDEHRLPVAFQARKM